MVQVMQDYNNGLHIEYANLHRINYSKYVAYTHTPKPMWDWHTTDYRSVPALKAVWANEYRDSRAFHDTEEKARDKAMYGAVRIAVKYQEVK